MSTWIRATFDADSSTTTFGGWVNRSGTIDGKKYNRIRAKTITDLVYTEKQVGAKITGTPSMDWRSGEGPHNFTWEISPSPGIGTHWVNLTLAAYELKTTTTTTFSEYWFKNGNNWTPVFTSGGSSTSQSNYYNVSAAPSYSYEVVDCPL